MCRWTRLLYRLQRLWSGMEVELCYLIRTCLPICWQTWRALRRKLTHSRQGSLPKNLISLQDWYTEKGVFLIPCFRWIQMHFKNWSWYIVLWTKTFLVTPQWSEQLSSFGKHTIIENWLDWISLIWIFSVNLVFSTLWSLGRKLSYRFW